MNAKVGSLNVDLTLETARFEQGLRQTQGNLRAAQAQIETLASRWNINLTRMGQSTKALGQQTGGMQSGMQQLSFQLNDIATQFASGTKPMQIFAQQAGQTVQAIQLMAGGTSRFAAFLGGPWGIAITAGVVVLSSFVSKLFESDSALKKVEFASSGVSDAQGILGNVLDLTTGKINTQSKALLALAQAQILVARVQAQARAAEAKRTLTDIASPRIGVGGGMGGGVNIGPRPLGLDQRIVQQALGGVVDSKTAINNLERFRSSGRIKDEDFAKAASAIANYGAEQANVEVFTEADKLLNGQGGRGLLKPKTGGAKKGGGGKSATEIERRFNDQLTSYAQQTLSAQQSMAQSADERAELELRSVELSRIRTLESVNAEKEFSDAQKKRLRDQVEILAQIERDRIDRERVRQNEEDAARLAREQTDGQRERLQAQAALADTDSERQRIALELLNLDQQDRRQTLERIIASDARTNAEKALAQAALNQLNANASAQRNAVLRQNETQRERYLRGLNQTPEQINEAIDGIKIDGLNALNEGLTDAIMGAKSLGDVFKNVANQIIADLVRIGVQKMITAPLAEAIFGGGGGGLLGGIGKIFGFATGTPSAPSGLHLVGERGPELVDFRGGERVIPNGSSRMGGSTNVTVEIVDTTGLFITRVNGQIAQFAPAIVEAGGTVGENNLRKQSRRSLAA